MDAITTSGTNIPAPANSLRGEWARFGAFLKRPTLPDRAPMPRASSLVAVLRMLLLDFAVMAVLLAIAGLVMASGVALPETALAGMDMTIQLAFAAIVFAPLVEEIFFRGWLSGRIGHILGVIILGGGAFALAQAASGALNGDMQDGGAIASGVGMIAALIAVPLAVFILRKHDAMGWFQRIFPLFFWLSTLAFSLVHIFNFEQDQMVAALPLVLPQFVVGAVLGYVRVNYGLWASVLLHMLHNGAFIGMVALAAQGAG